jgi:DNA mismatch repair protein MSH3
MGKQNPTPSKQQSISSFFTPKTVNGYTKSQPSQASQPAPAREDSNGNGNLYDADSDEEPLQSITNGASKRQPAEDAESRPAKRARAAEPNDTQSSDFFSTASPHKHTSKSKISPRTERYLYTVSIQPAGVEPIPEEEEDDQATKAKKEELHKKFVRKLGHPDSLKRRYQVPEDVAVAEGDEDEDAEEEIPAPAKTKKKGAKTGKLTPLELQILDIKRNHMDTLLIVEVGYKFKFFGEDARTAAKGLSIVCIPGKFRYDERRFPFSAIDILPDS